MCARARTCEAKASKASALFRSYSRAARTWVKLESVTRPLNTPRCRAPAAEVDTSVLLRKFDEEVLCTFQDLRPHPVRPLRGCDARPRAPRSGRRPKGAARRGETAGGPPHPSGVHARARRPPASFKTSLLPRLHPLSQSTPGRGRPSASLRAAARGKGWGPARPQLPAPSGEEAQWVLLRTCETRH
jgi:hypothetical protein